MIDLPDEPDEPFGPPLGHVYWSDNHCEAFYSRAQAWAIHKQERTFITTKSAFVVLPVSFNPMTLLLTVDEWDTEKNGPAPTLKELRALSGSDAVMNDPDGGVWTERFWRVEVTEGGSWIHFCDARWTRADLLLAGLEIDIGEAYG